MPSQIVNAAAIRADRYSIRCFASFFTGRTPVAEGTLLTTPGVPGQDIGTNTPYDVGAFTDLAYGMEVTFHDPVTDAFKGRTHIRYAGVINVANFPVREFAYASLNLSVGDVFKVYADWRLHDKLVAAISTFDPDYLGYSDQGSNPPPVACSGGHWAGKLDAGLTYATVLMTGSPSYTVDPDSGGSVTHLWTLPTGVTFAPGSANTDASPTLRVTVGEYLVYHAVTDSSNSKTTIQHVQLKAHDLVSSPPHRILYTPDTATADSGFGGTVQIVSGLTTQAAIPDGGLCIVWGVEYVNGQQVSYRNAAPGRAHILAVGIIRRDSQSGASDGSRTVTFEIISPLARLKEIASYSKVMEESATPDAWSEVKTLGVKRAIIQLIQFYSTLIEAGFDLIFDSAFIDYRYPALYLQRSTFYAQSDELAQGVDNLLTCDRTGRIDIHTQLKCIPEPDRAAITKTWTFLPRDILTFDFPREHITSVEQMKTSGFTGGATANAPVFSLYPGAAPGEGVDTPVKERLIVTDQDDLNERTGRYGAAADVVFQDADGLLYRAFPLTLTLRGVYDFFDFSKEYVDFSTTLPDLARDVDLTKFLFCLASTSVGYDEFGSAITTCVFDVVTNAAPGETFVPVQATEIAIPPTDLPPPSPIGLPPAFPGLIGRGVQNMALICVNGLALTTNFQTPYVAGGPTYVFYSWASLSVSGTVVGWVPRGGTSPAAGWLITSTKVYYLVLSTQTATDKHTFADASLKRSADAAFREGDIHFVVSSYLNGVGGKVLRTTDNTTFTEVANGTNHPSDDSFFGTYPGCFVSTRVAGKVVTSRFTSNGSIEFAGATSEGRVSSDFGATFGAFSLVSSGYLAQHFHFPWHDNPSESIFYYGALVGATGGADTCRLYRNAVDISPVSGGNKLGARSRDAMQTHVTNRQRMVAVLQEGPTPSRYAVCLTNDAGSAAPTWFILDALGTNYRRCALSGDDQSVGWTWGIGNAIAQWQISGTSAVSDNRTGNLASLSVGEILALAGY